MLKRPKPLRRRPRQARSHFTRNAIFEAVTQILESRGEAALTTNAIAERAGVSVGSLYQYFSSKQAILVEMARIETARMARRVARLSAHVTDPDEAARLVIRAHLHAFLGKPATRRAAVRAMMAEEGDERFGRRTDATARNLPAPEGASRIDAFVLTRAVTSVIRAAVLEGYSGLHDRAFEDALLRLVTGYRMARN